MDQTFIRGMPFVFKLKQADVFRVVSTIRSRRFLFLAILLAGVLIDHAVLIGQSPDLNLSLQARIDRYIDLRYEGSSTQTTELLGLLNDAGQTELKDLESLLRKPRVQYPDAAKIVGKTTSHAVDCLHVDYASTFFLYVPEKLDLDKPIALVVVGHGGNSSMSKQRATGTAKMYLRAYSKGMTTDFNAVVVAPVSERGWGHIGNSLILSTISKVKRMLPIDPDRIYITGQSMGGHLAYRSALNLPDRWGAVSPHSGGYDYVAKKAIENLINVPGYAIWGIREPYGINKDNRTNRDWAKSNGLDWKFVEKNGGHTIYQDELPQVAKFFKANRRNLYRKQVYIRAGGEMKFTKTWNIKGWPEHQVFSENRPLRWNLRHWIEVVPRPDIKEPLVLRAENMGNNQFEIECENVREFSIYLHPRMVDLQSPVRVIVNGKKIYDDKVESDPALMFELAREFDDRGRIYWSRIKVQVTGND